MSSVICSGSLDLLNILRESVLLSTEHFGTASEFSHKSVLSFMIENGVDINEKNKYNETPIHWAAKFGHQCVMECIINQRSDINSLNNNILRFII